MGPRYLVACRAFQPDVIHCSSPGVMWLAALIYSRLLKKPLIYSYHTHVPEYMPRYVPYSDYMHVGHLGAWVCSGVPWQIEAPSAQPACHLAAPWVATPRAVSPLASGIGSLQHLSGLSRASRQPHAVWEEWCAGFADTT